jgi:hypothetical protein
MRKNKFVSELQKKTDIEYFRERWYDTVTAIVDEPYRYQRDEILETLRQLLKEIEKLPSIGE